MKPPTTYHEYHPEVRVTYSAAGRTVSAWVEVIDVTEWKGRRDRADSQSRLDTFEVQSRHPLYYDPANPGIAVLTRGDGGQTLWITGALATASLGVLVVALCAFAYALSQAAKTHSF